MILNIRNTSRLLQGAHRVLGLSAGLLLAVLGASGAAVSFGDELDVALHPQLRTVEPATNPLPLSRLVEAVAHAEGGGPVVTLLFPEDLRRPVEAWLDPKGLRRAYLDRSTGEVLRIRDERSSLVGALRAVHIELFAGPVGHRAVGVLGLLLIGLCATGVARWWPGRRSVRASLAVRVPLSGPRGAFDLHKLVGVFSAALLMLAGLTGSALVFPGAAAAVVGARSSPGVRTAPRERPLDLSALDTWLARAEGALPGGRVVRVHLPTEPTSPVRIRKRMPGEAHPNGMSFVDLDPLSGEVLRVDDARAAGLPDRLLALRFPLHTGTIAGSAGRVIAALCGLSSAWLAGTGVLLWARRRRTRSAPTIRRTHPNRIANAPP